MAHPLPGDEYMRLLYEQAAREQRELAERVRAAHGRTHSQPILSGGPPRQRDWRARRRSGARRLDALA